MDADWPATEADASLCAGLRNGVRGAGDFVGARLVGVEGDALAGAVRVAIVGESDARMTEVD